MKLPVGKQVQVRGSPNLNREDYGLEHAGSQGPDEAQLAPGLDPAEDDVHEARGEGLPDVHDARALDGGSLRPVT